MEKTRTKLVIQGSHMVSGARCPAWSDQVMKWTGSRVVLELAGNSLAELLAEIPTALLAEMFLLLAENSRNFKPFLTFFTQILKKNHQQFFFYRGKHDF